MGRPGQHPSERAAKAAKAQFSFVGAIFVSITTAAMSMKYNNNNINNNIKAC
jgi:hypothetical protein